MATFHNTVTIARPAYRVFAFLADFTNIPAWNYAITRTVQTSPGPAGAGTTYRQTRTIPRRSEEAFKITHFAPPSRLAIKGQIGPLPRQQQLPARARGGQDPAGQHCRIRTLISAAPADQPACRPESQGSGRA